MLAPLNVLGTPIKPCSHDPMTGWFRDGCCNTDPTDRGSHTICCRVTTPFLEYLAEQGNDLMTPATQHGFPGLRPGDQWCVCAARWEEARRGGAASLVVLEATHERALEVVDLGHLQAHAVEQEGS